MNNPHTNFLFHISIYSYISANILPMIRIFIQRIETALTIHSKLHLIYLFCICIFHIRVEHVVYNTRWCSRHFFVFSSLYSPVIKALMCLREYMCVSLQMTNSFSQFKFVVHLMMKHNRNHSTNCPFTHHFHAKYIIFF